MAFLREFLWRIGWGPRPRRARVAVDERGATLFVDEGEQWSLPWADVAEVVMFKRDLWTVDLLCVGLRAGADAGHRFLCVHENLPGWGEFTDGIDQNFQRAFTRHWEGVIPPAFELNWTTVWGQASLPSAARTLVFPP